jgi:site-specific DNA-methyltransferase (adenine-specific)
VGTEEIKTNKKEKGSSFTSIGKGEGFNGCPESIHQGRWPANLIHDGSDEVVGLFPDTGKSKPARTGRRGGSRFGAVDKGNAANIIGFWPEDAGGSAARFFYCAKASKRDRDEGCEGLPKYPIYTEDAMQPKRDVRPPEFRANHHPTVKPTALMRYLCRLVTPPNGVILDPFMGSGSTGKAAMLEGFRFIGIDKEAEYVEIARRRIGSVSSR